MPDWSLSSNCRRTQRPSRNNCCYDTKAVTADVCSGAEGEENPRRCPNRRRHHHHHGQHYRRPQG